MGNKAIDKDYLLRQLKNFDEDILENKYVLSDELGDATTVLNGTLVATNWANNTQTVTVQGIGADTKGTIGLLDSATSAQIEAARSAKIVPTTIGINSITFTCEEVPSIDIPFGILIPGGQVPSVSATATIDNNVGTPSVTVTTTSTTNNAIFNFAFSNLKGAQGESGQTIQVSTLPTASATEVGNIYQYVGATDSTYTNGYFYKCVENSGVYSWEQTSVQPNEGGSVVSKKILNTKPVIGLKSWKTKEWFGITIYGGSDIWTDGENIYYDQYVLDKSNSTWSTKTWYGEKTKPLGHFIWTDGNNIYYSDETDQYVLDKSTSTWNNKIWNGLTDFDGDYVWTDGIDIYYSRGNSQYVLNKSTSTWSTKTWNGLTNFRGEDIWTDGNNIYYSHDSDQYVLNRSTSTWSAKTWNNKTSFSGEFVWSDGEDIYLDYRNILNKATSTWEDMSWNVYINNAGKTTIWTDGENIYINYVVSGETISYVLDRSYIQTM